MRSARRRASSMNALASPMSCVVGSKIGVASVGDDAGPAACCATTTSRVRVRVRVRVAEDLRGRGAAAGSAATAARAVSRRRRRRRRRRGARGDEVRAEGEEDARREEETHGVRAGAVE